MDFCHELDRYDESAYNKTINGYVTAYSINLTYFWGCQFIVLFTGIIALSLIAIVTVFIYNRFFRKPELNKSRLFRFHHSFLSIVNDSLSDYISEKTWIKISFFIFGCLFYAFGWLAVALTNSLMGRQSRLHQFSFDLLLVNWCLPYVERIMQLFLLGMIGVKQEMLLYAVHPSRISNTAAERRFIVQSQFVRVLVIVTLFNWMPHLVLVPDYLTSNGTPTKLVYMDNLARFMFLYYAFERFTFLFYEDSIVELLATENKVVAKAQAIDRFMKEYGPTSLMQKLEGKENKGSATLKEIDGLLKPRFEILNSQLELLTNDTSVPLAINSGDIPILQKFYWWVVFLSYSLSVSGLLAYFIEWLNFWYAFGNIFSDFLEIVVHPFIALPLFCSKIIFGSQFSFHLSTIEQSITPAHDFELT